MWEKRITHPGLNAFRVVRGQTRDDVERKAASQEAIWEERWQRKLNAEKSHQKRLNDLQFRAFNKAQVESAKALALDQTRELEREREALESILARGLALDPRVSWEQKKEQARLSIYKPEKPVPLPLPSKPLLSDSAFTIHVEGPNLTFLDKLIARRKIEKLRLAADAREKASQIADRAFQKAIAEWEAGVSKIKAANQAAEAEYQKFVDECESARKAQLNRIELQRLQYTAGEKEDVEAYIEDVLSQSEYPDSFPKEHRFDYIPATKTLVLDFELPDQRALPKIKEVKYVASRSEFQEVPLSEVWIKKAYDDLLYQISLRTMFELFESDEANALVSIVFNGWVRSIDKATGSEVHSCIMSLEATKDEFLAINLHQVDCKACFKRLKGVSASKLIELHPIKPLMMLNKQDARFVEGYEVVEGLDERTNLAAMDWLDFENLIRELFEKEFRKSGGEVKITQASRDGGVDAVAFDPDPIRGGKIVIQAKRYTNTVGVSAVRDLYGTVHNEGANKGILVTTSDFGPDAYAFAKDKPLTLLSGGELLYLLEQHGHSAKIDLSEAKRLGRVAHI